MLSPLDRSAHYCCSRYNLRLVSAAVLDKFNIWRCAQAAVSDDIRNRVFFCIVELLFIRCKFYTLELLSRAETDSPVSSMSTY